MMTLLVLFSLFMQKDSCNDLLLMNRSPIDKKYERGYVYKICQENRGVSISEASLDFTQGEHMAYEMAIRNTEQRECAALITDCRLSEGVKRGVFFDLLIYESYMDTAFVKGDTTYRIEKHSHKDGVTHFLEFSIRIDEKELCWNLIEHLHMNDEICLGVYFFLELKEKGITGLTLWEGGRGFGTFNWIELKDKGNTRLISSQFINAS